MRDARRRRRIVLRPGAGRRHEEAKIADQRLRRHFVGGDGDERARRVLHRRQVRAQQRLKRAGGIVHSHNFVRAQQLLDLREPGARAQARQRRFGGVIRLGHGGPRNYGAFYARASDTMTAARMLDAPTLILALALDDLVLAAALWVAIPRRHRHGVPAWSVSLALQALSFTLIGVRGQASLVEVVSLVVINVASALSLSLQVAALREVGKQPLARAWHLAVALAAAIAAAGLARHPSARIAIISVGLAGAFAGLGVLGRRLGKEVPGRGYRLLCDRRMVPPAHYLLCARSPRCWCRHGSAWRRRRSPRSSPSPATS